MIENTEQVTRKRGRPKKELSPIQFEEDETEGDTSEDEIRDNDEDDEQALQEVEEEIQVKPLKKKQDREELFFTEEIDKLSKQIQNLQQEIQKLTDVEKRLNELWDYTKKLHAWSEDTEGAIKELQDYVQLLIAKK